MALGIGAIFSLVYGVLLRPLPYPGADRFVRVREEHPGGTPAVAGRVPIDPLLAQRTSGLSAIARLAPGVTAAQAEAEGTAAARSVPVTAYTQLLFGKGGPPVVRARSRIADVTADVKPALLVLGQRSDACCSSHARTSPTNFSRAVWPDNASWPSAPDAVASRVSC